MSILAVQIRAVKDAHVGFGSEADICSAKRHVRYGPKADISNYSITSSACNNIEDGTARLRSPDRSVFC